MNSYRFNILGIEIESNFLPSILSIIMFVFQLVVRPGKM
jgi:hypothetical protein